MLPFPLAKVKGELLLYSTVDAAQAMLSALHQGAERLILPYAESDQILNILAGRLSAAGCLVSKDLVEPTVSAASGITVTGQVQFDYDPIALGYKTDHFKMLVMNSASSSSGGTQPVPIEIGSGVKSEFRQISPTLYEYKITNMPSTRVMKGRATILSWHCSVIA